MKASLHLPASTWATMIHLKATCDRRTCLQEQDIEVPSGPVRVKQRTLTATTSSLAGTASHEDVHMHAKNASTAPLPLSAEQRHCRTAHPALSAPHSDSDEFSDEEAAGSSKFRKYEDTVMLTKAGRGYQPQGYWGPDDGTDPADAAARSEWQQVDMDGKVLQVAGTAAPPPANASTTTAASTTPAPGGHLSATAVASPAAQPAVHPALAPGGWSDDEEGGFGSDQRTPEYTWSAIGDQSEWRQAQRALRKGAKVSDDSSAPASQQARSSSSSRANGCSGDALQVQGDTELLPNTGAGSMHGDGNAAAAQGVQKRASAAQKGRSSMFTVHEDTELLPAHPALATHNDQTIAVREDTECLTRTRTRVHHSSTFDVREDTELLGQEGGGFASKEASSKNQPVQASCVSASWHSGLAATVSEAYMVHEDTEILAQQPGKQRSSVFDQQAPPRVSAAFNVREDTELLTQAQDQSAHMRVSDGDGLAVHEDTELLDTRTFGRSQPKDQRASRKQFAPRSKGSATHPALMQHDSEFDMHQDTELLTQQPTGLHGTGHIGVHEDTELLTGNLQRPTGSIPANPERVTAPLPAQTGQSQV